MDPIKAAFLLGEERFLARFAVVRAWFDIASNFSARKSVVGVYFCCFG
jgi:hypothetical protein